MRVVSEPCGLGPAQFACPIDHILDAEQEQQRGGLDQHHPEVRQTRQGIGPHLRDHDSPKRLTLGHAIGFGGFDLPVGHRLERTGQNIACKCAKDDGKGQHRQRKAVNLVIHFGGGVLRHLGGLTDDEIIALTDRLIPVGTKRVMTHPFDALIECDHEEKEKRDVGHAAHHGHIDIGEPSDRRKMRARPACGHKAEAQSQRGRDCQKQQHRPEGGVESHVLSGCHITTQPRKAVQRVGISAIGKDGTPVRRGLGQRTGRVNAPSVFETREMIIRRRGCLRPDIRGSFR